jgi:hypothetical protein
MNETPNITKNNIYNRKINSRSNSLGVDPLLSEIDPFLEQADVAELGLSHEVVNDELYLPSHPSRDWIRCYISTTGPGCYRYGLKCLVIF